MTHISCTIAALSVVCAMMATAATTSTPEGFTDELDIALERAKTDRRHVLVVFSGSDWCVWCRKLEREVLSTEVFRKGATNAYELVYIDNPRDREVLSEHGRKNNERITREYGVRGFPAVLVLDGKGRKVTEIGYVEGGPEKYLETLAMAIREAPDVEKYIRPIEAVLNRYDDEMQKETAAAMEEVLKKFPNPEGAPNEKDRRRLQRAQADHYCDILFGRIADKYIPLCEKAFAEARAMKVPTHMEAKKLELIESQEKKFEMFKKMRDGYKSKKTAGVKADDGDMEDTRPGHVAWLGDWSENIRTNMALETCASFRDKKLRPFLMREMDPYGKATAEERRVLNAAIDHIWGVPNYKSFRDSKRLVEILERTAKKPFADMTKASIGQKGTADATVAWLESGRFAGEDLRCVFWTLRTRVNFGSTNILAKLEKTSVDEWLKLLWRIKVEKNAAWRARGGGYANTVSKEGWKGFANHGDACRAAFKRAMELYPYPEASYLFSELGPFDDEVFTSATAVQLDYVGLFVNYLWYNCYPRWRGSLAKMKAFAERCYDTKRHDTMIPLVYAEALLRMVKDSNMTNEAYFRDHQDELDKILEVSLPQIANTNAFPSRRKHAGAFATLAYSLKGDWEKAGETFRSFEHQTFPNEIYRVIAGFSAWWRVWDGISGRNCKDFQRLHRLYVANEYSEFVKGLEELRRRAGAGFDKCERIYADEMEVSARMKTDFPSGKAIVASFPKDKTCWLTYDGVWRLNGEYAFYDGSYRPSSSLEWAVDVPGEFRMEIEIAPNGKKDAWRFHFCQKPGANTMNKRDNYPFLMLDFAKDSAMAAFGEWSEVKDGGTAERVKFAYSGGSVRLVVIYKGGWVTVSVEGEAKPIVETDGYSRVLGRIKDGRLQFNGSGARLLSMKIMCP